MHFYDRGAVGCHFMRPGCFQAQVITFPQNGPYDIYFIQAHFLGIFQFFCQVCFEGLSDLTFTLIIPSCVLKVKPATSWVRYQLFINLKKLIFNIFLQKTKVISKIINLLDVFWQNLIFFIVHFNVLMHFFPDQMISQTCVIAPINGLESGITEMQTFSNFKV